MYAPRSTLLLLGLVVPVLAAQAQPASQVPNVAVAEVLTLPETPMRLAHDPVSDDLYVLTTTGNLYLMEPPYSPATLTLAATPAEHGTPLPSRGLTVGPDGTLYLTGNERTDTTISGVVRRGVPNGGGCGRGRRWPKRILTRAAAHRSIT